MAVTQRLQPCLWFDSQAEEAARFYVGELKRAYEGEPSGTRR